VGNEYDLFLLNGFATYLLARTPVLPTFRIAFLCGFDPNNVGTTKSAKHIAANVLKILDRSDQACISSSSKPSDFIAFSSSPLVVLFFLFASSSSFSRGSNAGPTCHRAFIFGATENPPPFLFFSIFLFDDDDDDDDDDDAFVLRSPLQSDAALRAGDEINLTPPEKETTNNNGAPEEGRKVLLLLLLTGVLCDD
jgi:hypothetical protein